MILLTLIGDVVFTSFGDIVNAVLSIGLDLSLLVFFLNHFADFFASGGRYR